MPIPTTFADLSTTAASNSPAGNTNPLPDLDNYLRAFASFLASIYANSGNGWTSPYLPLAGGTLTGGLIGTTASFTGNVTLGDAVGDTLSVGGSTIKNGTGNWTLPAPSAGTTFTTTAVSGGIAQYAIVPGASVSEAFRAFNGTATASWFFDGSNNVYFGTTSAHPLYLRTSNTDRVTIAAAGNVTIAAPSSGTTLDLGGLAGAPTLTMAVAGAYVAPASIKGVLYFDSTSGVFTISSRSYTGNTSFNFNVSNGGTESVAFSVANTRKTTFGGGVLTGTSSQAFTATPTFDANLSNVFELGAMTANVTSCTISNATAGQTIQIRVKQDATGGRTFASPAGAKITGSVGATASAASILTLTYSSADARWEGSWLQLPV